MTTEEKATDHTYLIVKEWHPEKEGLKEGREEGKGETGEAERSKYENRG